MNIARKSVRGLVGRLLGRAEARRQQNRLRALDDHLLRDIGLLRDQVDQAFSGRLDTTSRG